MAYKYNSITGELDIVNSNLDDYANRFVTDAGTAIPIGSILNILGGNNISTSALTNTLTIDLTDTTDHCVQVGNATGSLTSLGAGTTGELLIGNTGTDPAFGSTAYADFSFNNITSVATPRMLTIANTDVNAASHADLRLSTPPLGGDSLVSWEVQGSHYFAAGVDNQVAGDPWKLSNSSHPSAGTAAITVDATTAAVTLASAYEFPVADGNASEVLVTDGAGNLDFAAAGSLLTDLDNTLYVGKHGNDANNGKTPNNAKLTIQAAVTAAVSGDSVIVYPGTYTETITHAANNVTLIAAGKPSNCIITQADANVINFSSYTGIQYRNFRIQVTAATTAINTIQGTTGSVNFKECQLRMTCAADIAAVNQPAIGSITGAGIITVVFGKHEYNHTGNGGGTAQKGAFKVGTGGEIDLTRIEEFDIVNSGTALASTVGIDTSSTGYFKMNGCNIDITDPDATVLAGLAYLGGTGTENEFRRNTIHITATNNVGYGFFASDTASSSRFFYNHIHVEDTAGTSYSYHVGNTSTVISVFDDIIAADGIDLVAGGTFTCTSSLVDGDLTCRGREAAGTVQASIMNMDNTATASNAALNLSVGGTTSTGDPYVNYLVTGGGTFSTGIDNTVANDPWKLTTGATPSAGTDCITVTSAGAVSLNSVTADFIEIDGGYTESIAEVGNIQINPAGGQKLLFGYSVSDYGWIQSTNTGTGPTPLVIQPDCTAALGVKVGSLLAPNDAILAVSTSAGAVTTTYGLLSLTNESNAAAMTGTGTGILFNQWYHDLVTPAIADSGAISVLTEGNWTSTASTQDSSMNFQTCKDGTVATKAVIASSGNLTIQNAPGVNPISIEPTDFATGARIRAGGAGTALTLATNAGSLLFKPADVSQMVLTTTGGIIYTPTAVQNIVAGTGITAAMLAHNIKIQGSGGAVDITANPQIAAGTDGQVICFIGQNDTNTVTFDTSNGLKLNSGASFTMGAGDILELVYDSGVSLWLEKNRSDNS